MRFQGILDSNVAITFMSYNLYINNFTIYQRLAMVNVLFIILITKQSSESASQ